MMMKKKRWSCCCCCCWGFRPVSRFVNCSLWTKVGRMSKSGLASRFFCWLLIQEREKDRLLLECMKEEEEEGEEDALHFILSKKREKERVRESLDYSWAWRRRKKKEMRYTSSWARRERKRESRLLLSMKEEEEEGDALHFIILRKRCVALHTYQWALLVFVAMEGCRDATRARPLPHKPFPLPFAHSSGIFHQQIPCYTPPPPKM